MLSMMLAAALLAALSSPAFAVSEGPSMTKADFAAYCDSIPQTSGSSSALSDEEADLLLLRYVSSTAGEEQVQLEAQLNTAGIYIYSDGPKTLLAPAPGSSCVTLSNVVCSYDRSTGDWTLAAGGHWNDRTYMTADTEKRTSAGAAVQVGGRDSIGIVIRSPSGTLPPLKASLSAAYDEQGGFKITRNPSTGDTKAGIAFQYQDTVTKGADGTLRYMGYGYGAVMRFGSDFADWSGYAQGVYCHTWSGTAIDCSGFDRDHPLGLRISWSEQADSFEAYSPGETKF